MTAARSPSSNLSRASSVLRMERLLSSKMFIPPTVTAIDAAFSRAPPQAGQGTSRMYS